MLRWIIIPLLVFALVELMLPVLRTKVFSEHTAQLWQSWNVPCAEDISPYDDHVNTIPPHPDSTSYTPAVAVKLLPVLMQETQAKSGPDPS
ncbi:MAG: hypothetical protein OHK0039_46990 [Bacteroidia bacterium]